jgi:hypothetical protein
MKLFNHVASTLLPLAVVSTPLQKSEKVYSKAMFVNWHKVVAPPSLLSVALQPNMLAF